jgi:hypothetical protein
VVEFVGVQNEKKIGVFEALWRSFFDSDCYVSAARDWSGISVTYLLVLTLVFCSLVVGGLFYRVVSTLCSANVVAMMDSVPRLKFNNGVMSTVSGERVDITNPGSGKTFLIVDPKDTVNDMESTDAKVLLQSKNIFVNLRSDAPSAKPSTSKKPTAIPLAKLYNNEELDGKQVLSQLKNLANASVLPIFLLLSIGSFLFILFKSLLLAVLLKLLRSRHSILGATRLIIMATTPSLILSGVSILAGLHFGKFESSIFTALFFGYVWLAFFFCRREDVIGK